ncbi:MAG: VIT and VWA domain-containing protein [Burkholderiaceae bacterium]|nr:VIT and VWA domain-containing protein [Burkholderiaceae bacterium]
MSVSLQLDESFHATLQSKSGEPMVLQHVAITGDLRGAIFDAHVRQTFINPSAEHLEAIYSFPLPWGAQLLGVEVKLNEQLLQGMVVEKSEAQESYEETLADGNAAILLERGEDGNYVLNLGNLAPGERCVIDLHYGQLLQFEQGGLRLKIPTVIAPRYGDLLQDGGLQPHQVPETDLLAEYGFALSLTLHGALAQARVGSPSHPINVSRQSSKGSVGSDAQSESLTITLGRDSFLDRDFVLVMDQLEHCSIASVAPDYVKPEHYVVTASFCPSFTALNTEGQPVVAEPLSLKILVDCSGSMAGDSIQAARRALHALVDRLGKQDTFSLSKFGSAVEHRSRAPWPVTEATQLSAQGWISSLNANMGGTELESALTSTLALSSKDQGAVMLITDGHVSAVDAIIKRAKSSKQRIFVIGIGSSASEGLLKRLALETKGACDFVAPGEAVEPAILRMFNRLRTPVVTNITIEWPEGSQPRDITALDSAAFEGDTLHISAWFDHAPTGTVTLKACLAGDTRQQILGQAVIHSEVNAEPTHVDTHHEGPAVASTTLSRLAAASRLSEDLQNDLHCTIALDYQLVSRSTSFLLKHIRAEQERALAMPRLHKVKQMMPAGFASSSDEVLIWRSASLSDVSYTDSMDMGVPSLLRNPRVSGNQALNEVRLEMLEETWIPSFLRRSQDDTQSTYQHGETIKLYHTRIWSRIDSNGQRERAIINKSPTGVGVRVWFFNDLDQTYDFVDYSLRRVAERILASMGFVKMPKELSALAPWARLQLTWKAKV